MTAPLLSLSHLCVNLGGAEILRNITLHVDAGESVCLLGPNGAGKSTVMKTIAGFIKSSSGSIRLSRPALEISLHALAAHQMPKAGVRYVGATENVAPRLTVLENLMLGGHLLPGRKALLKAIDEQFVRFPGLAKRRKDLAGNLSGGEQKLVAIARALIGAPSLLLLDEPSIGLSASVADEVFDQIRVLPSTGMGLLIVEQSIARGLSVSDRTYVIISGKVDFEEASKALSDGVRIADAFFGAPHNKVA